MLTGRIRSAEEHRADADRLAAGGRYGDAIVERIRGHRRGPGGARDPAPQACSDCAESSRPRPAPRSRREAGELTDAARRFDDVRYGGRAGTEPAYRRIRDLDVRLKAAAAIAADPAGRAPVPVGLPLAAATLASADDPPGRTP